MSMNLTLHDGEVPVDLWQTPSHITWMCLSYDPDGNPDGGMEGVRRRYLHWCDGTLDGVYTDGESLEDARWTIEEHKKKVLAARDPQFSFI